MKTGAIVFARMDSIRMPGKVLRMISGKTIIDRVLDRVLASSKDLTVIIATTNRLEDDPIVNQMENRGLPVYRGAIRDVAMRALLCAKKYNLQKFLRISADSPFIDPNLIKACLSRSELTEVDLVTNVFPRTYPTGMSVEVITRQALDRIISETKDSQDREHVTRYVYSNPKKFLIDSLTAPDDRYLGVKLAVDTPCDYAKACWMTENYGEDLDLNTAVEASRAWDGRE